MSYGVHRRGGAATAQVGAWLYSTWVELEELQGDFFDFVFAQWSIKPRLVGPKQNNYSHTPPLRDPGIYDLETRTTQSPKQT